MLYTGGTTGMPKGVMWRHQDVIFTLGGGIDHATGIPAQRPEDLSAKMAATPLVSMAIAPLMHGASQWATLRSALHRQQGGALRRSLLRPRRRLADHREGARADARDHRRRDGRVR